MAKYEDLTGQKFGNLTVIKRGEDYICKDGKDRRTRWICRCECGNETLVFSRALKTGASTSCGCSRKTLGDLTGKKFGKLTVVESVKVDKGNGKFNTEWLCRCECGGSKIVNGYNLTKGMVKSCGCEAHPIEDLTGQRFGKLVVLRRAENHINPGGQSEVQWVCKCDCGNETIARGYNLKTGHTKSCGCNKFKHNLSNHPAYRSYISMINRCYNKNIASYERYGGRGITVCDEWLNHGEDDFTGLQNFINWSERNGYEEGLTIDRIDNNGNYCPENCRWASYKEQNNNRSINRIVEYNNDTFTAARLAEVIFNIPPANFYSELNRSNKDVNNLITPVRVGYGFTVNSHINNSGKQIPMNAIYFVDENGYQYTEQEWENKNKSK